MIEADRLAKGFGDRLLIDDLSFKLPPGGIVGVIGPNGAGETTLFRMIVGQEQAGDGTIRVGDTVKLGYVDQSRDTLEAKNTVFEEISGGGEVIKLGPREVSSRAYVSWFNFKGSDQQKKVGSTWTPPTPNGRTSSFGISRTWRPTGRRQGTGP